MFYCVETTYTSMKTQEMNGVICLGLLLMIISDGYLITWVTVFISFLQHIQELMKSWEPHLAKCHLIFYHAKHHNRRTLFSGKKPILYKEDERLRKIPFSTKRAKFSEVKRTFGLLSEILVHGKFCLVFRLTLEMIFSHVWSKPRLSTVSERIS